MARMLKHMVCVRFKPQASPGQIEEIEREFARLPEVIDGIEEFEAGRNVSVEDKALGFTHLWLLTFRDQAARDAYLPHPAHQAFSRKLSRVRDAVFVFDYLAGE